MKTKLQFYIIVLGIISSFIAVRQILQIPTMILASWFLVLIFLSINLSAAFILGYLLKALLKSEWFTVTFASIFVIIISLIFCFTQYLPTSKVVIPENYVGEVKLFLSNEKENDFNINSYGIGYINKETFDKGFSPEIIRGKNNITKEIKGYSKGSWITTQKTNYSFEYLSFSLPSKEGTVESKDVEELLNVKAIDTTRLFKKQ